MSGVAFADTLQDTIEDSGTGVSLVAGSSTSSGTAEIRLVGNNAAGDPDPGCNIDAGEVPLSLDVVTPAGVTANPDPLSITACGTNFTVTFTASATAVSGTATVSVVSGPAGGGTYANQVNIPITITQPVTPPAPANTAPTVSVTGVTNGATYAKSAVSQPGCSVVDAEDTNESANPQVSNGAFNTLGSHTVTCSYTDSGQLTRTATATYTVARDPDTTAPVVSYILNPTTPSGTDGWYTSNVSVNWTVTEAESPEVTKTGCADQTITADQAATTYSCAASSEGGTDSTSVTIKRDAHAPVVSYDGVDSGVTGSNGWYTSPVSVRFNGTDALSGPANATRTVSSSADGAAVTLNSPAFSDAAGNTTPADNQSSPAFKIDTQAPNAPTAALSAAPNSAGWHNGNVVVTFTRDGDNGPSGVAFCTADVTVNIEAANQTVSGTCTDAAGNVSGAKTVTVSLDKTGPSVSNEYTATGTPGANGWFTSPVEVTFTATDKLSGLDVAVKKATSSGNGAAVQVPSPAFADIAGNTTPAGAVNAVFMIDTQAPNAPTAALSAAPNSAGWHNGNVVVTFTRDGDNGPSGVASCTADVTVNTEDAKQTVSGTCTDNAGNVSGAKTVTISLDKTGPVVSNEYTAIGTKGTHGWYTSPVEVTFTATDALSGLDDAVKKATSSSEGAAVQVASPAFTDIAGNTTAAGVVSPAFKIDTQAPNAPTATLSQVRNLAGWNNTDVVVKFTSADDNGTSGVAFCTADVTVGIEGAAQTVSGTCTDEAGNVSAAKTVTVSLDKTGPVVSEVFTTAGTKGTNDWYTSPVEVTFTATDKLSGLDVAVKKATSSGDGSAVQVPSPAFTDIADNTTPAGAVSPAFKVDTQAPNAPTADLSPARNVADWNNTDVVVDFTADGDNGPSGVAGCSADITVDTEGADQTAAGTCIDNAGNVSVDKTVTVNLDKTRPVVSELFTTAGTKGTNDWYTSPVEVTFTATDKLSGLDVAVKKATSSGQGDAVQVASPAFTDIADNTTPAGTVTPVFKIDTQAPNAPTVSLSQARNGAGWNNTDVTVDFVADGDNGPSGVASCTADITVDTETANRTVSGTCTDAAGNISATKTITIKLDKTGPTVSNTVTATGTPGTNGWYTSDVEATFTATDTLSGLDVATKKVTSSGEGAAVKVASPAFTDIADNTTPAGAVNASYKVDKTAPTTPTFNGGPSGSYYFGADPAAPTCSSSDATSGLASCMITGGGTTVGDHTYTATATDNAGNKSTAKLTYTVLAWSTRGYLSPVDMGGVWNGVKGGSTVPLKFEVFTGTTELTSITAVKSFTTRAVACPGSNATVDEIETVLTGGTSLRYDSTGGQFIQNWQTPKKPGTCAVATTTMADGSTIIANFLFR